MKNFLSVNDVASPIDMVKQAIELKNNPFANQSIGKNKTLGLLFYNPSLRTRLSSQKAAYNLGMNVIVMNLNADGWQIETEDGVVMNAGSQEHIKEAAGVISQYCDIIGIRTFPELKDKLEDYEEGILNKFVENSKVPVVSLESATLHPLQSLADAITIYEQKTVKRPKVVLTWAPHPRSLPQAVSNSFVQWMKHLDVDLQISNPKGFDLLEDFTEGVPVTHNQDEALAMADFVYVKNWSSFEDYGKIGGPEFSDWQITSEKMGYTNNGKFIHCLPVRRNVVVADEVIDSENSLVLEQANNRTFAMQTVLHNLLNNN